METYTRDELKAALIGLGIGSGDIVFFQSRLYGLGKPEGVKGREELCEFFLNVLLEVIGEDGTLVTPTYTTQVARFDEPYIVEATVPNYGLFPGYVFNHKQFVRSLHPLISVAATGRHKEKICRSGGISNFGARSPFDMMVRLGAKNVFLGIEIKESGTLSHYMEMHAGVPYVYNKMLKWRPVENGVVEGRIPLAAVRYLDYKIEYFLERFQNDLMKRGCVKTARVGGGNVYAVTMDDMLEVGYDGLEKDPFYFLVSPPDFDYGKIPFDGPTVHRELKKDPAADAAQSLPQTIEYAAPQLSKILGALLDISSPAQKKALLNGLSKRDEHFFREGESLADALIKVADALGLSTQNLAEYYNMFCRDTIKEQMEFRRSGSYSIKDYDSAIKEVYSKDEIMEYYMIGLMLSQFLWADSHWRLQAFAKTYFFAPYCLTSKVHVEVGPGHGWFALLALRFGARKAVLFDISERSAKLTRTLLETQEIPAERWSINIGDFQRHIPLDDGSVDTFTAGEVLEHIPDPAGFLREANRILRPGGAAYVTTAANAPSLDHLYLFNTADEIRNMIAATGFCVEREIENFAGMIGDKPVVNYGAVIRKNC